MPKGIMTTGSVSGSKAADPELQRKIDAILGNKHAVQSAKVKDVKDLKETEALFDASIEAKPLQAPSEFNITRKHTEYYYRWVNMKARGGVMYSAALYKGFSNATTDDADVNNTNFVSPDGTITNGELILMKIPKEVAYGAMKYNLRKSMALVSRAGQGQAAQRAAAEVKDSALGERDNLRLYIPNEEEVKRATDFAAATSSKGETSLGV